MLTHVKATELIHTNNQISLLEILLVKNKSVRLNTNNKYSTYFITRI